MNWCRNQKVEQEEDNIIVSGKKLVPSGTVTAIRKIRILRIATFFFLGCLVVGLGAASYILNNGIETNSFKSFFESSVGLISITTNRRLNSNIVAGALSRSIFNVILDNEALNNFPNITFPGFESIMHPLSNLASSDVISYLPIVTEGDREGWEAYAKDQVKDRSSHLKEVVAGGIYLVDANGAKIRSPDYSVSSKYPQIHIPIWQGINVKSNITNIMYDVHSELMRAVALDEAITNKKPSFTDIIYLINDIENKPTTLLYTPLIKNDNVVGMISISLTWDEVFHDSIPSFASGLHLVLSTSTQTLTYLISNGNAKLIGIGDLHDRTYNKYAMSINLNELNDLSPSAYTLMAYPTIELFNKYNTFWPGLICGISISLFMFISLGLFLMDREQKLLESVIEAAKQLAISTLV